jgi:NAD(P)-dependent dehydrogenase (short-subunit alcohol dehydrogenase family)
MKDLQGKTALITGGSIGIGYGIAEALLREGMQVVITGRTKEKLQEAWEKLQLISPSVAYFVADVRNLAAQHDSVRFTGEKFGSLDVLIANAGVGHFAPIDQLSQEQWHDTIDINLTGVFNTVKAALTKLEESQGYIITIASLAGTNFFATGTAYNASKFGLVGFTQALMLDVRKKGIKVTTIMPGSVATHFNDNTPTAADDWKIHPEDIGQMVVDLLKMPDRTLPSKVEVRPSLPQ